MGSTSFRERWTEIRSYLRNGERIRLIGVDTPKTKHPNKPVEFFGKEAAAFTKRLAEGKLVKLEYDQANAYIQHKDRYGRPRLRVPRGWDLTECGDYPSGVWICLYPVSVFTYGGVQAVGREAREKPVRLWLKPRLRPGVSTQALRIPSRDGHPALPVSVDCGRDSFTYSESRRRQT